MSGEEKLIFEKGSPGRKGCVIPELDLPEKDLTQLLPEEMLREEIKGFPELSEREVVRHFTRLSRKNYGLDTGFYPLGSCTMKYNPRINEEISRLPGFSFLHPFEEEEASQGAMQIVFELEEYLAEISGMDKISLQPAAGAQGELTALLILRAYFKTKGEERNKVIIPDSAHGTNPASCSLAGYEVKETKSNPRGLLDLAELTRNMDKETAALMLTNPNTLGFFEKDILKICEIVHEQGGMVYCDGANLNALLGIVRPGDLGIDLMQFNLHKTFSTPHGGGGPGAGPLGVKKILAPYLPVPRIEKKENKFILNFDQPTSIGKVTAFYGNFAVLVRAYAYIRSLGAEGLKRVSETAVLNANYLKERLKDHYYLPYPGPCMHECLFSDKLQQEYGLHTLDIAKALMDYGFHPPTIYFPLIIKGAMLIEPTETENKETIDRFIAAMIEIARLAKENPQELKKAPQKTPLKRLDETAAARRPKLRWEG